MEMSSRLWMLLAVTTVVVAALMSLRPAGTAPSCATSEVEAHLVTPVCGDFHGRRMLRTWLRFSRLFGFPLVTVPVSPTGHPGVFMNEVLEGGIATTVSSQLSDWQWSCEGLTLQSIDEKIKAQGVLIREKATGMSGSGSLLVEAHSGSDRATRANRRAGVEPVRIPTCTQSGMFSQPAAHPLSLICSPLANANLKCCCDYWQVEVPHAGMIRFAGRLLHGVEPPPWLCQMNHLYTASNFNVNLPMHADEIQIVSSEACLPRSIAIQFRALP
jgi:hypothetical protein